MLEQSTDSQRFKILAKEPSPQELEAIMDAAAAEAGMKFYYGWTMADDRNFALCIERGGSIDGGCEWRMFSGDGKEAVELWYLASDDPVIIKELIREASAINHAAARTAEIPAQSPPSVPSFGSSSRSVPKPKPVPHFSSSSPAAAHTGLPAQPSTTSSSTSIPAAPAPAPAPAANSAAAASMALSKRSYTKVKSQEATAQQTFTNLPIDDTLALLPKEEMLKGNLKLVHITNLLQSIGMGAMSGRLKIQRHANVYADIFFLNGQPVHAEGTKGIGDDCFLQVVCWAEGDFMFEPKLKTDEKTLSRSLESLILEGVLLLDHTNYLMKAGVRMTSVFEQTNEDMTEAEFEEVMAKGDQLDMAKLKDFYVEVDGREVLEDIVNELDLLRSQWVPIVSNLLRMKVIELCDIAEPSNAIVHPKDINSGLIESVRQGLVAEKTGIFSYAAFLFLLGVQIKCSTMPLSVMLIEVKQGSSKTKMPLSLEQVQELSFKVDKLTSSRNIFAHYEESDFAVILLGVRAEKAARIAERLVKALSESGFESNGGAPVHAAIGVASHPDDAQDLGSLLGEAERAKTQASKGGSGVTLAND
jgi:hypothetical protein